MAYWLAVILLAIQLRTAEAHFDRFLTLRNIFESLNYSVRSLLLCTPTHESLNSTQILRALDTGQGIILPNKTQTVHLEKPYHALRVTLFPNPDDPVDRRFGAYTCQVTVDNVTTTVTTFKRPSTLDGTAEIRALGRYLRASSGEPVELKVEADYQPLALRWRFNGQDRPEWENLTEVVLDAVTSNDSGIYEIFYDGRQELGKHALMQLTVRECPPNKWGEYCNYDCPVCYNGGMCNAKLGLCICPPGFIGDNCELPCEPNTFGEGCEKQCDLDDTAAPEDACAAFLFCLPEPYGCSCGAGFRGDFCYDDCDEGLYGADCTQECHCREGHDDCNAITGQCDDGCAFGWAGESCQIPIKNMAEYFNASGVAFECPLGHFGFPFCNETCHCAAKNACDPSTGVCPSGCAEGWDGTTCSECVMGMFGQICDKACHCELGPAACNTTTGACEGGCGLGYVGPSCQEECSQHHYGSNCSSTCLCQNGGRCILNGSCECVSKWRGDSCDESAPHVLAAEDLMGNVGATVNVTCLVWSKPPADIQIWSPDFPGLTTDMVQMNESLSLAWTQLELNAAFSISFNCSASNIHGRIDSTVSVTSVECPKNTYGPSCSSICSCLNGGRCNAFNGACECVNNWHGDSCDEHTPVIIAAEDVQGYVGETANITCLVWSQPQAEVHISSIYFPDLKTEVVQMNESMQLAWTLLELNDATFESYNCSALNKHGRTVTILVLMSFDMPVLSSRPTVVSRTVDTLELQWDPWRFGKDKGGRKDDIIEYLVVVRFEGYSDWYKVNEWSTATAMRVTRLLPGTTYEFAVRCRVSGRSSEGEPGPYTTVVTDCLPDQANVTWPQEFKAEEVGTTHVRLQWMEPTEADLLCPLQKYVLQYWPKDSPMLKGPTLDLDSTQDRFMLDGLVSGTDYVVELSAVSEGVVVGSPARIFVTPHTAMTGPVEGLEMEPVQTSTEALVSWYEPVKKQATISKYLVKYQLVDRGKCGYNLSHAPMKEMEVSNTEVILTELYPFSAYEVSVQPITSLGTGEMAFINVTTFEGVPVSSPSNVRKIATTPSSLGFCWEKMPCEDINGIIANYEYKLTKVNHSHSGKVKRLATLSYQTQLLPATPTEVVIQNLESRAEYEFVVRGITAGGPGPWSVALRETTLEDVPSSPSLIVWSVTSTEGEIEIQRPPTTRSTIKAYQLKLTRSDGIAKSYHLTVVGDPLANNYTLKGLRPGTCYNLTVISHSEEGWSNQSASVGLCTENELPGPPTELELVSASPWRLVIIWRPPHHPQRSFIGYRVKYRLLAVHGGVSSLSGQSTLKEIQLDNTTTKFSIAELEPHSQYEVMVVTYSQYGESQPVKKVFETQAYVGVSQRLSPPPPPEIYSAKITDHTVPVRIFPVKTDPDFVRSYQLIVEDVGLNNDLVHADYLNNYSEAKRKKFWFYIAAEVPASDVTEIGYYIVVGNNKSYEGYLNAPLDPNHHYKFHVRSMGLDPKMAFSTLIASQELVQTLNVTVDDLPNRVDEQKGQDECMQLGLPCVWFLVIIIVLTLIVLLFLLLLLCTRWRKHSHGSHKIRQPSSKVWVDNDKQKTRSENSRCVSSSRTYSVSYSVSEAQVNAECGPIVNGANIRVPPKSNSSTKGGHSKQWLSRSSVQGAIPVSKLSDYIHFKFSHPMSNFQDEFKQILNGQTGTWLEAKKSENLKKNRYGNILPYDHTRVCLQPLPHILHSDYINASFIEGYRKKRAYIAAQGPKENYFADFWRMVWQERVPAIVMVTGLVEMGRVKCDQYWPNDGCIYGDLHITLMETRTAVNTILRLFLAQKISTGETRRIKHYQLLDWPDQSIPMYASPLLNLRNHLLQETSADDGPLVVHCSAGIGRTGTFIAVDALLHQATEEGAVDVFSYVNKIRLQRISMVQTLEQYIFIYETILEALEGKDTKVMASHLATYFKDITTSDPSILQQQFTKLADNRIPMNWHQCSDALEETNLSKNRDLAVLPSNTKRVRLSTLHRCCSSDYINAVFCDSYKLRNLFLSTQVPLSHTVEDFWAMVSNYQSSVIVVLHGTGVKSGLANCAEYWPTDGCCHYGRYQVQVVTFQRRNFYIEQNLKLIDDDAPANAEPQRIVQLQFTGEWADGDDIPRSPADMAALIRHAATWNHRLGGPITVLCMDGASRCGLFCVGSVLSEQLRIEGAADVFQVVRRMQKHRSAMITSAAQYQFCYELAVELVE